MKITNGSYKIRIRNDGEDDQRYSDAKPVTKAKKSISKRKVKKDKNNAALGVAILLFIFVVTPLSYLNTYVSTPVKISGVVEAKELEPIIDIQPRPHQPETVEELMCQDKYKWDCELMIAIAKSENGYAMYNNTWGERREYTANNNGSIDTGILMVNSVHGYNREWLKTMKNNIDAGYKVWLNEGYGAWSDYNNGRYEAYTN